MTSGSNEQLKQELECTLLSMIVIAGEFQKCNLDIRRTICNKIPFKTWKKCHAMKAGSTAMTQRPRDRVPSGNMLALPYPKGQTEQIHLKTFDDPFFDSTGMIYMHWVPTWQTVNEGYSIEILREFRKRFRRKRPALFKSSQWHFHQNNAPVHNSILVTNYLIKMGIKTLPHRPYSPDLAPCNFLLFLKLRGCRYETIEEMKEDVTRVIDTLTQEDFHGTFQKLLERYNKCIAAGGDYFEGN